MKNQSNALWPDHVYSGPYGDHISTDMHDSAEAAEVVCQMLVKHGFGGEGLHLPLRVWISEEQQPPRIPE